MRSPVPRQLEPEYAAYSTFSAASRKARSIARCARYSLSEYRTPSPVLDKIEYREVLQLPKMTKSRASVYRAVLDVLGTRRWLARPDPFKRVARSRMRARAHKGRAIGLRASVTRLALAVYACAHLSMRAPCSSEELGVAVVNFRGPRLHSIVVLLPERRREAASAESCDPAFV